MPEENGLCAPPADAAKGFGSAILRKTGDVSLLFLSFPPTYNLTLLPLLLFLLLVFFFLRFSFLLGFFFFFFFSLTLGHI